MPHEKHSMYHEYNRMSVLRWRTWSVSLQLSQLVRFISTCTDVCMKLCLKCSRQLSHTSNNNIKNAYTHSHDPTRKRKWMEMIMILWITHVWISKRKCNANTRKLESINIAEVENFYRFDCCDLNVLIKNITKIQ